MPQLDRIIVREFSRPFLILASTVNRQGCCAHHASVSASVTTETWQYSRAGEQISSWLSAESKPDTDGGNAPAKGLDSLENHLTYQEGVCAMGRTNLGIATSIEPPAAPTKQSWLKALMSRLSAIWRVQR